MADKDPPETTKDKLARQLADAEDAQIMALIEAFFASGLDRKYAPKGKLTAYLRAYPSEKLSQAQKLRRRYQDMTNKSQISRKEETQRKIILGAFVMAQMEGNPKIRGVLLPELRQFLEIGSPAQLKRLERLFTDIMQDWGKK